MPFLQDLKVTTLKGKKSLVFFVAFSAFCFSDMVQTSMSMQELASAAFAIMGIGLSPVMPMILRRAGRYPGIRPALASTVISTLGYSGMLILPPSLGYVASHFGLEAAFLIPLTCIIIVCLGSFAFREKKSPVTA